ncbi:glycosyltransferase [uncultured Roseibium sp.]|uniref:glycosyltransferase n=1 Tax=uncultured Roseibium sp. TaxID=1936171 RepID=UPI0025971EF3|nr:glycosyltransferase [uncultured Roseibium sp.]
MKILLVTEPSGGGSGRHVLDLASSLADHGHGVHVIWSGDRADDWFVSKLAAQIKFSSSELLMKRSIGPADLRSYLMLAMFILRHGPFDVTHGHSSKAGALVRLVPGFIAGKKIYTPHAFRTMDPSMGSRGHAFYNLIERVLAYFCTAIICVSRREFDHALALGIDHRKLRMVPNGANPLDEVDPPAEPDQQDAVVIGFIGRLAEQKNPELFVEAIKLAHARDPRVRGLVLGDGALRSELEKKVGPEVVEFAGWVSTADYIREIDVFCQTSRYEAMPYTMLEALFAGLPMISTDVGGVEETIQEGVNGFVLPFDASPTDVAEKMLLLAGDKALRAEMSEQSRAISMTKTIDVMATNTIDAYCNRPVPDKQVV